MIPQVQRMLDDLGVAQYAGPAATVDAVGKFYTCLANGVVKPEGEEPRWALSEEDALAAYCEGLHSWLDGRTSIVWRVQPEMESATVEFIRGRKQTHWMVYSRLTAYHATEFYPIKEKSNG